MKFTYNRGNWENSNSLPEWIDDEEFTDYLTRIGFSPVAGTFGFDLGGQIDVYESNSDKGNFYASVSPFGETIYEVFLPDFPSLMMFLRDHASVFSGEASNFAQQEILSILEKLFQAEHGHPASNICPKCSPDEWKSRLRAKNAT